MCPRLLYAISLVAGTVAGCSPNQAPSSLGAQPSFLRYYGEQPPLQVRLLPGSGNAGAIEAVVKQAKAAANLTETYWPEPSDVVEHEDVWWVKFAKKERLVLRNGHEEVQGEMPSAMTVEVGKGGGSCRILPAR